MLTADEILAMSVLILAAGNETTMNLLSNTVLALAEHPEAATRVRTDRTLVPQLIEEMRRVPALADIPVILVTAKHNEDHSWLAGGDGYIVKPFTADALREKIEEVLLQRSEIFSAAE